MRRQNENFNKYQAMPKFLDTVISSFSLHIQDEL